MMNKLSRIPTLIVFLAVILFVLPVSAGAIKKGNDEVFIATPGNNQVVSGNIAVKWFFREADQTNIPFQIDLFAGSCPSNGNFIGIIANGEKKAFSSGKFYSQNFDTDGPIKNLASIKDGNYCVRTCGIFRESPSNFYGLCDKHSVIIANKNRFPSITSKPGKLSLLVGQTFQYKVKANDPDNDKLTYTLTKSPGFISINNNNGTVKSKGALPKAGNFEIRIKVSDGKGGTDTQVFTLNVRKQQQPEVEIEITSPNADSVFTGTSNKVEWSVTGVDSIASTTIAYSLDGETWLDIANLEENPGSYTWNVSDITSGEYLMRITVIDSSGNKHQAISELFLISNDDGNGGEQVPVINIISPGNDETITNKKPEIKAEIIVGEGAEIAADTLLVTLDEQQIGESCTLEGKMVTCTLESELENGRHLISIQISDNSDRKAVKQWFFEIKDQVAPTPTPDSGDDGDNGTVTFFGREIPSDTFYLALVILCIGLLLLLVPWLIYIFIIKGRREQDTSYQYPTEPANDFQINEFTPAPVDTTYTGDTVNIDQNYVAAPTEPAPQPQNVDYSTSTFEPSIGSQEIGSSETPEPQPLAPQSYDPAVDDQSGQDIQVPSIYSDEDIPDWLKTTDSGASDPVAPAGGNYSADATDNENQGSEPFDDYGLASRNESDNQSS